MRKMLYGLFLGLIGVDLHDIDSLPSNKILMDDVRKSSFWTLLINHKNAPNKVSAINTLTPTIKNTRIIKCLSQNCRRWFSPRQRFWDKFFTVPSKFDKIISSENAPEIRHNSLPFKKATMVGIFPILKVKKLSGCLFTSNFTKTALSFNASCTFSKIFSIS